MSNFYDELLRLCGFEDEEIREEKPRIDKAFDRLELGPEDMKTAQEWVRQNHDIELVGVRKLLRAWLKELVDLVLAKDEGKRIIYYGYPSIQGPGMAIKSAAPDEVYVACPDVVLCHTLGQIFNKLTPVLEAGEENGLPPGHGLCTLQTIRVGGLAKGIIPVPDLVTGSSYYCDMGSKTDELLHERYGHHAVYVDGCMDSRWGEYPGYLPERVELLGPQLNKIVDAVRDVVGIEVTGEAWDKAMTTSRKLFHSIGHLARLTIADPVPISSVAAGLAQNLAAGATGTAITEGPEAIDILCQEVERRVNKGVGVVEKGAPRVMNFAASFSDPTITRMIENVGLAMAATILTVPPPKAPKPSTYTMEGERRAEREMQIGMYHSTFALTKRFADAVSDLKLDGIIWSYQYNCRPVALPSHVLKKWIEETTGVPVLSLEWDMYDSRSYSAAALRTRVETFAELLRVRKGSIK